MANTEMQEIAYITQAIYKINSEAEFTFNGVDLDTIQWLNGTTAISKSNIETKITELKTAFTNNAYQRKRLEEYPSLQEQMDLQYKDLLNGTTTWKDAVAKVKTDNPKE